MNRIGIVAQNQEDKFGVNTNYLEWINQFGHPVIITPCEPEEFFNIYNLDALLLPGGADVNINRYSELVDYRAGGSNPFLEYFDVKLLPLLIGEIPIFGICRGLQTLNVTFGGTLYQDVFHPHSDYPNDLVHQIILEGAKNKTFKVNSFHHQAISRLANNFIVEGKSDDGYIEAISDYKNKIFAVQWHPERLWDNYSYDMMQSILQ